jgi:polyphosphate kinase 2 (PPK2 family)
VGQGHRSQGLHRVRGPGLGRKRRHDPPDHRADEPAGVQAHRPADPDRPREVQRYIAHFPAAGEVAIFDRSWYNRAGVELVLGYCTPEQSKKFVAQVPAVEQAMVDNDIILIKYWLNVSVDEQTRRLESRIEDPRKVWKLSPTDLKSYSRHYEYCQARDAMLAATDTAWAPWYVVDNDDKKRGRLNIITHLLSQIPYRPLPPRDVKMPKKPSARGYSEPDLQLHHIPTPF